jgi:hypothetical protein
MYGLKPVPFKLSHFRTEPLCGSQKLNRYRSSAEIMRGSLK